MPEQVSIAVALHAFAQLYVQVATGLRPLQHLQPFMTPGLWAAVVDRRPVLQPTDPFQVGRVLASRYGRQAYAAVALRASDGSVAVLMLHTLLGKRGWRVADARLLHPARGRC